MGSPSDVLTYTLRFSTNFQEGFPGSGALEPRMHVVAKPFAMEALAGRIKELINAG